jgi:hypothetical protein
MEFVSGEPIDLYCRKRNLDLDARLALFIPPRAFRPLPNFPARDPLFDSFYTFQNLRAAPTAADAARPERNVRIGSTFFGLQ